MSFRYLRDPLFLACVAIYFVNRWVLKRTWDAGFVHAHLNDLICIPFCVPIMLGVQRKLGLRPHDASPRTHEIVVPLMLWSLVFEVWFPTVVRFQGRFVADPLDVLHYALGALVAAVWWRWYYRPRIEVAGTWRSR
jgi:hypothetical protein